MSRLSAGNKAIHQERYDCLDGLRAYSAIGIVLMHVLVNGQYTLSGFLFETFIPACTDLVFLFMILSAFSLCCGYYERIRNREFDLAVFYNKRFAKIWPFFAILCVLDFVLSPSVESLYEVFANLTLAFGLIPNADITVIGVGWFIGVVFVFYMIFPFYCYLLSDKRRVWIAFAAGYGLNRVCQIYFVADRKSFIYCFFYFVIGGLIYLYRRELTNFFINKKILNLGIMLIGFLLYCMFGRQTWILGLLFGSITIYGITYPSLVLNNPMTQYLSRISMEVYLCHMIIFRIVEKMGVVRILGDTLLSYLIVSGATIAGAVLFSIILRKAIQIIPGKRRLGGN